MVHIKKILKKKKKEFKEVRKETRLRKPSDWRKQENQVVLPYFIYFETLFIFKMCPYFIYS